MVKRRITKRPAYARIEAIALYEDGAQGRNRTTDTAIFSRMLYQLSYLGAPPAHVGVEGWTT